ncbi:MAG: hypothetical protein Q8R82_07055 [Hyphomonadaceae bacterium]|nr:hypothetical protein [Hyphomonadaceae bacterium]
MGQTVTTIEALLPHLEGVKTARELGARVIAFVPTSQSRRSPHFGLRQQLAKAARDHLGFEWSDKHVYNWLAPALHTEDWQTKSQEAGRRWKRANAEQVSKINRRWAEANAERIFEKDRRWYEANRCRVLEAARQYQLDHPERGRERMQRWRAADPEGAKRKANTYQNNRYANDPIFKVRKVVSGRIKQALKCAVGSPGKSRTTIELLGCSAEQYRTYLESLFDPNMTWENWGEMWEIDHIVPIAAHDLSSDKGQQAAFHYSNTVPLSKAMNRIKGSLHDGKRHRHADRR